MTEDEMVEWHHRLNGHRFGWTPGVGDGQGGLACSPWGRKELVRHDRVTELNAVNIHNKYGSSEWSGREGLRV